jgi:NarL family two-component system sensor histidine kinase YdfH
MVAITLSYIVQIHSDKEIQRVYNTYMKKLEENRTPGLFARSSPSDLSGLREVTPFFAVVTIVMIGIYIAALMGLGEDRTLWHVSLLTVMMLVHLALYWGLLFFPEKISTYVLFLAVQSALAFGITLLSRQATLSIGLYAPLVGVAVGSLRNLRWKTLSIAGILFLATLNAFILPGSNLPVGWFWIVIPVTLFVIIYVELYSRQSEAREESQRLLQELEIAHKQLSEYAVQVENLTLAQERQRIARELHDTLAQGLVGLILQLEAVTNHLEKQNWIRAQEIVRQAMSRARVTLADARSAIGDLREMPALPDDVVEIVQAEINRFTGATGIPCEVDLGSVGLITDRTAEHVQRIVAEALINIARHAQAHHVQVSLSCTSDDLIISIQDDGVGFDLNRRSPISGHYGLLGMRERARLARGTLDVDSLPGVGTTVKLILPIAESEDGV